MDCWALLPTFCSDSSNSLSGYLSVYDVDGTGMMLVDVGRLLVMDVVKLLLSLASSNGSLGKSDKGLDCRISVQAVAPSRKR